jgi:hypothetical protein
MAKRKNSKAEPGAASAAVEAPAPAEKLEFPALAPTIEANMPDGQSATSDASLVDVPTSEPPAIEAPTMEASQVEPTEATAERALNTARSNRFALLAASVAVAAALGAVAGAVGASGILHMTSQAIAAPPDNNTAALQASIGKLQSELASLRASVDTAHHAASGQFTKISERLDQVEHGQADRTAKLAKAMQAIQSIEKRADAKSANDITGSVPTPVAAPRRPVIPGWSVRRVRRGIALLDSPRLGLVEVERGDVLPPVGRIEQIKKEDGRWVVVTTRGIIISMR